MYVCYVYICVCNDYYYLMIVIIIAYTNVVYIILLFKYAYSLQTNIHYTHIDKYIKYKYT